LRTIVHEAVSNWRVLSLRWGRLTDGQEPPFGELTLQKPGFSFWDFVRVMVWPSITEGLVPLGVILAGLLVAGTLVLGLADLGAPNPVQVVVVVPVVAGAVFLALYLDARRVVVSPRFPDNSLESQLKALAKSLSDASAQASTIEEGIRARQKAVEDLHIQSEEYDRLSKLNKEAADAITKVVERAVGRRERRSLLANSFVAFVVGLISGLLIDPVRSWIVALAGGHR
jgi:hypothetical protein